MEAMYGAVVTLDYTLTLDDGEVLGEEESVDYLHGYDNIMPGLERALEGIKPGERRAVLLEPAEAYGERELERLIAAPIAEVPDAHMLKPGMRISTRTARGPVELTVAEVNDDTIVFDANHPLAGRRLRFDVSAVDVRPALRHELRQGHPGPEACNTFS